MNILLSKHDFLRSLAACGAFAMLTLPGNAAAQEGATPNSMSVFGANSYLSEGATALMLGNYRRGVELTRKGLVDVVTTEERVASLSNLCAGYVGLEEFETAVVYCDRSLEIDPTNWRALQNRAAAYIGTGEVEKALRDVEQGLELNPDSEALKVTLAIVREQSRRLPRTTPATTTPPTATARPAAKS